MGIRSEKRTGKGIGKTDRKRKLERRKNRNLRKVREQELERRKGTGIGEIDGKGIGEMREKCFESFFQINA
jgi:hypothetical protein